MNAHADSSQRFLFDGADVRGESVRIGDALADMLANKPTAQTVKCLLGEFAAAAVLISNNLKYDGRIILQARSDQAVSLVMVECSSERHIRGIAQGDIQCTKPRTPCRCYQVGSWYSRSSATPGNVIRASSPWKKARWRSLWRPIFPRASNWAPVLAGLRWQAKRRADAAATAGPDHRRSGARRAVVYPVSADRDSPLAELLGLPSEDLLFKLYQEETVTVYPPAPILFKCRCSRERSAAAIALLPESEREEILTEEGDIAMTCELCGKTYRFDREGLATESAGNTLH